MTTLNRQINIAAKIFYALKNASNSTVLEEKDYECEGL